MADETLKGCLGTGLPTEAAPTEPDTLHEACDKMNADMGPAIRRLRRASRAVIAGALDLARAGRDSREPVAKKEGPGELTGKFAALSGRVPVLI